MRIIMKKALLTISLLALTPLVANAATSASATADMEVHVHHASVACTNNIEQNSPTISFSNLSNGNATHASIAFWIQNTCNHAVNITTGASGTYFQPGVGLVLKHDGTIGNPNIPYQVRYTPCHAGTAISLSGANNGSTSIIPVNESNCSASDPGQLTIDIPTFVNGSTLASAYEPGLYRGQVDIAFAST
jgi:hypothetical protein